MIVVSAVAINASTFKELSDELENMNTPLTLNDDESRLALPRQRHHAVPVNRTAETAFSVYEADDPLLDSWPFLLIARTGRIVTAHVFTLKRGCDTDEYRRILGVPSI